MTSDKPERPTRGLNAMNVAKYSDKSPAIKITEGIRCKHCKDGPNSKSRVGGIRGELKGNQY